MTPFAVVLALLAAPASEPPRFTGATVGISAHGGPTFLTDERLGGRAGFAAGFGGRFTSPLFLADLEVSYGAARVGTGAAVIPFDVTRHGFSVTAGLHPFFIAILGNRRWHYIVSAFHVDLGASLEVTSVSVGGDRRTRGDPAWHWGLGIDIPLTDPNGGRAVWLGVAFRQVRLKTDIAQSLATELGGDSIFLSLGYRWNWK